MIRYADVIKDKEALVQGLHDFVQHINKPNLFPDIEILEREEAFMNIIQSPAMCTIVDEVNGELVGGIGLAIVPYMWNPKHMVAEELFWWCTDKAPPVSALRLIRAAHDHCKLNNVHFLSMSMMYNSPKQVETVYGKLGLEKIQSTFAGVL